MKIKYDLSAGNLVSYNFLNKKKKELRFYTKGTKKRETFI